MMVLALKSGPTGARVLGLTPQAVLGIVICYSVYEKYGLDLTISCGTDGKHSRASKHYSGNAWDMRSSNIPAAKVEPVRAACATALGDDYDVVLEGDHIHCEFDPKTPINEGAVA